MILMQYLVIVEESGSGFGAYVPDLPGCIAAAETRNEVVSLIQEAIEFHIDGLKNSGEKIPQSKSQGELVEIQAA